MFRLDGFHRIDSRCAIARVFATSLAPFEEPPSLEGVPSREGPAGQPRLPARGGAVTPAGAVSSYHVRAFCEALVRRVALPCACVLHSAHWIHRSLDGVCRARPPSLEVLAARSSHALPHDELGHPGLSAAPEKELQFRMGAVLAVTPVLSTDVYKPTIRLIKNGHPPALVHSARFPTRAGALGFTPSDSSRRSRSIE